jgi:GAF domain-containing protein
MTTARRQLADRMIDAARDLQHEDGPQATMDATVSLAVANVHGCDAAGVTIVQRGRSISTPAASADWVAECDQLQYTLGEGPCLEAIWDEPLVHSADLAGETRWPTWATQVVTDRGVGSMLCVRLFTRDDTLGALNHYAMRPHAFDSGDLEDGLAVAAHAAVALASSFELDQLGDALATRTLIGQASGILMERYGLDSRAAFNLLTRISSHSNVKIRVLAHEVVTTGRLPQAD